MGLTDLSWVAASLVLVFGTVLSRIFFEAVRVRDSCLCRGTGLFYAVYVAENSIYV